MLAELHDGDTGLLTVITLSKKTLTHTEPVRINHLAAHVIEARAPFTLDGDTRTDLVVPWRVEHRGLTRFGLWIVRTDPVGLTSIELGTEFRGKATDVRLACFAALTDQRERMLVIHRKVGGQDELELQRPNATGGWSPARGLVAGLLGQGLDRAAAERRWVESFPKGRRSRRGRKKGRKRAAVGPIEPQTQLAACPREGLLLPSNLLSRMQGWTVLGPIGLGDDAVRKRLRALKGAPRAVMIIGLGQAQ